MAVTRTTTKEGEYVIQKFTGTGSTTWTIPTGITKVEYLIVAGGGGGACGDASSGGNGGNAGGVQHNDSIAYTVVPATVTTVTLGAGGAGAAVGGTAGDGGNSVFGALTATGGVKGLNDNADNNGGDGGSGHGAAGIVNSGTNGGNGGIGLASDILVTGTNAYYAAGGGGGGIVVPPVDDYEAAYGAEDGNNTGDEIGGGVASYSEIILPTDSRIYMTVSTLADLQTSLANCTAAKPITYVSPTANILINSVSSITVRAGIILASDRGYLGHSGGRIYRSSTSGASVTGSIKLSTGSRITGVRVNGPYVDYGVCHGEDVIGGIGVVNVNTTEIDNCEVYGWSYAGICLEHSTWSTLWYCHIHHNYIHHNSSVCGGGGYGYGIMQGVVKHLSKQIGSIMVDTQPSLNPAVVGLELQPRSQNGGLILSGLIWRTPLLTLTQR